MYNVGIHYVQNAHWTVCIQYKRVKFYTVLKVNTVIIDYNPLKGEINMVSIKTLILTALFKFLQLPIILLLGLI